MRARARRAWEGGVVPTNGWCCATGAARATEQRGIDVAGGSVRAGNYVVRAESIVEEDGSPWPTISKSKLQLIFSWIWECFNGNLTILPGNRGHSSVPLKL